MADELLTQAELLQLLLEGSPVDDHALSSALERVQHVLRKGGAL